MGGGFRLCHLRGGRQPVDLRGRQLQRGGGQDLLELLCRPCAGDRSDDPRLGEQPGERDGGHRCLVGRRDLVEGLQYRRPPVVEVSTGDLGTLGLHGLAARPVLAGQEALGQREVGQHGKVPGLGDGQQRALKVALDEVVVRLQDRELCKPMRALEIECRGEPLAPCSWRRRCGGPCPP